MKENEMIIEILMKEIMKYINNNERKKWKW